MLEVSYIVSIPDDVSRLAQHGEAVAHGLQRGQQSARERAVHAVRASAGAHRAYGRQARANPHPTVIWYERTFLDCTDGVILAALRIYSLQTYKKRIERIPICGLHKVHSTVEFKPTTLTAVVSGFGDRINHYFIRAVEWFKRPFRYFLPSVVGTIPHGTTFCMIHKLLSWVWLFFVDISLMFSKSQQTG